MPLTRAYSVLTVKAVDAEQRTIAGIASTPEPDRMGDVVEPLGITYKNPLPLLLYHDTKKPVGTVTFKKPTKDGLEFTASLPTVTEPGHAARPRRRSLAERQGGPAGGRLDRLPVDRGGLQQRHRRLPVPENRNPRTLPRRDSGERRRDDFVD